MRVKKANVIFEYGIVLSIIAMAMVGMHHYIKRGISAKVKDMTDAWIAPQSAGLPDQSGSDAWFHRHRTETADSTKNEMDGGNTISTINNETVWWNVDRGDKTIASSVRDVVDYAIRPFEYNYPDTEYIRWNNSWPLVTAN